VSWEIFRTWKILPTSILSANANPNLNPSPNPNPDLNPNPYCCVWE